MIHSQDELRQLLRGTPLETSQIVELSVLDTGELAFALEITVNDLEQSWLTARRVVEQTGRWPVISTCWRSAGGSFAAMVQAENLFSRFYFEEAPTAAAVSPRAIIEKSRTIDVPAFIQTLAQDRQRDDNLAASIDYELEQTQELCEHAPSRDEIDGNLIQTTSQLDRWLLDWELAHGHLQTPEAGRFDWFQPNQAVLLLLPTASSWETLAYLHWYGTSDHGAEYYIALGKSWEERFGAELVAHYGTMLQCFVSRPPSEPYSAWELAREHDLAAPCTLDLSGISVRHYGRGLVDQDRWFLHERP